MKADYKHLNPSLVRKIENSIALLRKAESLAKRYDPDSGFYLAFSGGKDSQCLYHVAQLAGVQFKAHFSPTSVDPPQLIRFIRRQYPDVEIAKIEKSIYQIAIERKFLLPSRIIRWCCAELKERGGAGTVCLTGVRKAESVKRSKRKSVEVSNRSFAGNIDEFHDYQAERIKKKLKHVNQDQFAEQGETEVRCIGGRDKILINPILEWSEDDVWDFLNGMEIPHCKLYDMGWKRIGCICCPMSSYNHKVQELAQFPHVRRKWINVIKTIREQKLGKHNMICNNYWGEGSEEEKCEQVFNWWISGKSYKEWYAETYLQLKINF